MLTRKRGLLRLLVIMTIIIGACGKEDEKPSKNTPPSTAPAKTKDAGEWKLVDTQDLSIPIQEAIRKRYPQFAPPAGAETDEQEWPEIMLSYQLILAPDGGVVFMFEGHYSNEEEEDVEEYYLCRYTIETSELACQPIDHIFFRLFHDKADIAWSPDGKRLALTSSTQALIYYNDVDLWLIDYPCLDRHNITEDNYNNNIDFSDQDTQVIPLDTTPIWNPANGDLYFLRLKVNSPDGRVWGWYRLKDAKGDPEEVFDLISISDYPDQVTVGEAALSPDSKRLIWSQTLRDEDGELWTIYELDLTSNSAEPRVILTFQDLLPLLPKWSSLSEDPDNFPPAAFAPEALAFSVDGTHLLVKLGSYMGQLLEARTVVDLDLNSGKMSSIRDYNEYSSVEEFYRTAWESTPGALLFSPDFHSLLYTTRSSIDQHTVWAMPIPFAGDPTQIGTIPEVEGLSMSIFRAADRRSGTVLQISRPMTQGRVLIGWTLLQFE